MLIMILAKPTRPTKHGKKKPPAKETRRKQTKSWFRLKVPRMFPSSNLVKYAYMGPF